MEHDAVGNEPAVFISARSGRGESSQSGSLRLIKSVITTDVIMKLLECPTIFLRFQACVPFVARDSSDMAIFHVPQRQNVDGSRVK